jgi:two-component system chemotaxis sensor kinase CheA
MDMTQYRGLFFSETREHINNLNKQVVILEREPGHRETINTLFREAHSIKGMAATMGFEHMARLSHRLEDMLDGLRSSGEVTAAIFDYLLAGIDLLDSLLDDLQENRPERSIDAFLEEQPHKAASTVAVAPRDERPDGLPAAVATGEAGAAARPAAASDGQTAGSPVHEAPAAETDIFQVLIDLEADTPASAARGLLILKELGNSGELIASHPDLSSLRKGAPCQRLQAWLRTSLTKKHVEEHLRKISAVANVRFVDDRRHRERSSSDEAGRTVRVRTDLLDQFVNLTGELITHRNMLHSATGHRDWNELNQALTDTGRLIDDLHHHVLKSRLMPLENITGRLPRIVRDLSRKADKKVTLQLVGADVGIDRVILEEITDPLVHLVRNAVDHGIDKEGIVTVTARRERDIVVIEVADDGRGMDPELLRRKAVERGLLTAAQAGGLSDHDALMLVCQPGFSTAEEVTETSGRGVGMDVVKAAVVKLGGTLAITSASNQGTSFQMRLPLSIAIIKLLLVTCAGKHIAIPITRVQRILDLPAGEIRSSGGKRTFRLDEETVSICSLSEALGLPEGPAGGIAWLVLAEVQGRRIGLQVDGLLGHLEAFVKKIGFPLNFLPGLTGATIAGDGRIVFVIDPQSLFENRRLFTID